MEERGGRKLKLPMYLGKERKEQERKDKNRTDGGEVEGRKQKDFCSDMHALLYLAFALL